MEREFTQYTEALALKELGFDEECFGYYTELEDFVMRPHLRQQDCIEGKILAPTWQSAFRWFRERYNLICRVDVTSYGCTLDKQEFYCEITSKNGTASYEIFNTYEEAELDCLVKLIDIVKE
tara:strand:- start:134 stop:499 length:366 start_codon:yes stop_codon:yes gene_type:complete